MRPLTTKSLEKLQQKMQDMDENSLRYKILESAKNFKTSWIELGQALYSVWKDKLYKEWGYAKFETYTAKEIGIKKQTAIKLLRSYYFLEKEEPLYLQKEYAESADTSILPTYESINVLRLAKKKTILDKYDYDNFKKAVFEKGKDASELKKDLTALIKQRQELEPEEAWEKKRIAKARRLVSMLKSLKDDIEISKMLPAPILKEVSELIKKLEVEIK